jgi:hypothetical protein
MRRQLRIVGSVFFTWLIAVSPAFADGNLNPGVLPPNSNAYGKTYGEWEAALWQWALGQGPVNNPLTDTTGANCAVGQTGDVWFLARKGGGQVVRNCAIPAGKAILIPIGAAECDVLSGNGSTEAELRACAIEFSNKFTVMRISVDGTELQGLSAPADSPYRIQSPLFTVTIVDGNAFGSPAGTTQAVADGWFFLLAPLSAGPHTIVGHSEAPDLNFMAENVFQLTIGP